MLDPDDMFGALDERTVLFAYDGSEEAKAAFLEVAHRLGPDRCAIVLAAWRDGGEEAATRLAFEGASLARSIGFDAQPVAASADPLWRSIAECAAAHDASIVVLAPHDRDLAAELGRHTALTLMVMHGQSVA